MSLDSPPFMFAFWPGVFLLFALATRWYAPATVAILLAASVAFYAINDLPHLPLLLGMALANVALTRAIIRFDAFRPHLVVLGVLVNLLPLVWFKYGGGIARAALPLGLSFYTFQQITALFDIQRKDATRLTWPRHLLFVSFFAQIQAGPISRYRELAPQLGRLGTAAIPKEAICAGFGLFVMGLAKKIVVADNLGIIVDSVHAAVASGAAITQLEAFLATWGFLLQIYFDFSGYSDMAIGVAMCFGVALPPNFNSPLQATTGSAFIDRWHLTLVRFVREYVYQPLFRVTRDRVRGTSARRGVIAWAVATIGSMGLLGAWHGSHVMLLVGGLLGGVLLVLTQLPALVRRSTDLDQRPRWQRAFVGRARQASLLATLSAFGLLTRANDVHSVKKLLFALVDPGAVSLRASMKAWVPTWIHPWVRFDGMLPNVPVLGVFVAGLTLSATLIALCAPNSMQLFGVLPRSNGSVTAWQPSARWGVFIGGLILAVVLLPSDSAGKFIYADF